MSAFTQHEDLSSSESLIASIFEDGDIIGKVRKLIFRFDFEVESNERNFLNQS